MVKNMNKITEEDFKIIKKYNINIDNNMTIKDILTFGDADNDYDMTLNAGIGVVMANGSEKTKSVADYITDDNDHDGIGNYIEKYVLHLD